MHNRYEISFLSEIFNAYEAFELLKSNGYGSTSHEANNSSMRQEINQESEPNPKPRNETNFRKKYNQLLQKQLMQKI